MTRVESETVPRWHALTWQDDDHLSIDDVQFWLTTSVFDAPSTSERFVLLKNRGVIDSYREVLRDLTCIDHVLEMGFFHGASTVLFDRLLLPDKLVAIDHVSAAPFLDAYRTGHNRSGVLPYYDTSQQDPIALTSILTREFPNRDLDLVIDDASHDYVATRAAFDVVWPFVRPGGIYVIEDWGWAHWPGIWQEPTTAPLHGPALSNLVFELVMMQATSPALISGLHVNFYSVAIVRGPADVAIGSFSLNHAYLTRGHRFVLL